MFVKARYLDGDLKESIYQVVKYPFESINADNQGDVTLSLQMTKDGKMDSLTLFGSPHQSLTVSALTAMDAINGTWQPATMDSNPIDKNYLIIFRYGKFLNSEPPNYTEKINSLLKREKFAKALKVANSAIIDNRFNAQFFKLRSIIFKNLDQVETSEEDLNQAMLLDSEILAVIDVLALGKSRRVISTATTTTKF